MQYLGYWKLGERSSLSVISGVTHIGSRFNGSSVRRLGHGWGRGSCLSTAELHLNHLLLFLKENTTHAEGLTLIARMLCKIQSTFFAMEV